ncbi:hypothetical protein [Aquipseudomonas alcaligenes]|uniref:Uncharacterized protein n=1 Tax=Aquipseudomonas alcaligenes TaxID=43263 RepID=A0A1N6X8P5_AQUAC|nr:hypothetical protein [Pseudomonas alcaligenes]SIQ98696.1 hypothetical protein SAMN05878282_11225 [Pseudomonas alcaligenes]
MEQTHNPAFPLHPFTQPLASRHIAVGKTQLADAKRNLAINNSFGHSFTNGPIFKVSRLMVDLPGAMTAEVAFNKRHILDVIVVKLEAESFENVINKLMEFYPKQCTVRGAELTLDLGTLVITGESTGFGKYPCLTFMSQEFYQARLKVRAAVVEKDFVA